MAIKTGVPLSTCGGIKKNYIQTIEDNFYFILGIIILLILFYFFIKSLIKLHKKNKTKELGKKYIKQAIIGLVIIIFILLMIYLKYFNINFYFEYHNNFPNIPFLNF